MKTASQKQKAVLKYLAEKGEPVSLDELAFNLPFGYYHNGNKHLSCLLSRMVANGMIEREKKGYFRIQAPKIDFGVRIGVDTNPVMPTLFD